MPEANTDYRRIGENVRRARHYRGMTLDQLAGLIGRSKSWLSRVENGVLPLEKRRDIAAIADALQVSASDLLGEGASMIPRMRGYGDLTRLREVLLGSRLTSPPDVPARPLEELTAVANGPLLAARRASDHIAQSRLLPDRIAELHVHVNTGDEQTKARALRLLIDACAAATFLLRNNSRWELAWIAADRAVQAAEMLGDPIAAAEAAFPAAHAQLSVGRSRALRETGRVADSIEAHLGDDRRAHQVYGMLRLSAALAAVIDGDHTAAGEQADEAARIADRIGDHADAWQWFGPANVAVWQCMLAVETGEPGRALQRVETADLSMLPQGRRSALHIELARAHAMLGNTREFVQELRAAERLDPPRVHHNPLVRELVSTQLERARRATGARELRGLAHRIGVV